MTALAAGEPRFKIGSGNHCASVRTVIDGRFGIARRGGIRMNQSPRKPKRTIEAKPESIIQIRQPMVRNYSTSGGHGVRIREHPITREKILAGLLR